MGLVVERKREVSIFATALSCLIGLIVLLGFIRELRHGFVNGVGQTILPVLMIAVVIYAIRRSADLAELDQERLRIVRLWYGEDVVVWQNLQRVRLLPFSRGILLTYRNQYHLKRHWLFTRGEVDDGIFEEVLDLIRQKRPDLFDV